AVVYAVNGLIEFLHYFYRGLSRTDVESSITFWQRTATLVCALAALAWHPTVETLAVAMLVPSAIALAWSVRTARRLSSDSRPIGGAAQAATAEHFIRDVAPIGAGIVLSAL